MAAASTTKKTNKAKAGNFKRKTSTKLKLLAGLAAVLLLATIVGVANSWELPTADAAKKHCGETGYKLHKEDKIVYKIAKIPGHPYRYFHPAMTIRFYHKNVAGNKTKICVNLKKTLKRSNNLVKLTVVEIDAKKGANATSAEKTSRALSISVEHKRARSACSKIWIEYEHFRETYIHEQPSCK